MSWFYDIPVIGIIVEVLLESAEDTPEPESGSVGEPDGGMDAPVSDYSGLRDAMGWTEVGGTGLDTRNFLLEDTSLESVQWEDEASKTIIAGKWEDINGYVSTNPEDFDIDHRVPFKQIVEEHPDFYGLPREEQLAIFNDHDNLQILHDAENMSKGDMPPADYAQKIADPGKRDEFLAHVQKYLDKITGKV